MSTAGSARALVGAAATLLPLGCSLVGGIDGEYSTPVESADGSGAAGGGTGGTQHAEVAVDANDRDAWHDDIDGALHLCKFSDVAFKDVAGLQWSLPVPASATIVDAHIRGHVVSIITSPSGGYDVEIHLEDAADALPYSDAVGGIRDRMYYADPVTWPIPGAGFATDEWIDSVPITALVQRAVDRSDWIPGQHIGIAIYADTADVMGAQVRFSDFSDGVDTATRLVVSWVP